MTAHRQRIERFADAYERWRRDSTPPAPIDAIAPEMEVAMRLCREAPAGVPDPAFIAGLRGDLLARARGSADTVRYTLLDTPVGTLGLAYHDEQVVLCNAIGAGGEGISEEQFRRAVAAVAGGTPVRDAEAPPALERSVRDHFAGRRRFRAYDLSHLTPFQRRVLEKTAEIPRGEVRPYAWVAREIGARGATRAVGTALGHNPIPFLIPCHRVIRADGSLGEYSGGGPAVKARVLMFEGAPLDALQAAAARGEHLVGCRSTHIVCYPSCRAARRVRPENVRPFASLAMATGEGYRPCALCRPA